MYRKYSLTKIKKAIVGSYGIKKRICLSLGCSRTTFDRYLNENAELKNLLEEEREMFKDLVESQLVKAVESGEIAVLIFCAKTLCKDRGYVERIESHSITTPSIVISSDEANYFEPNEENSIK